MNFQSDFLENNEGGDFPRRGLVQSLSQLIANARVVITEQPASGIHRFRYQSEGNTAGSIIGENSTDGNKTFPAIQILGCQGYTGNAFVKVSCVNKDPPYRKHPYRLVSKEDNACKNGICIMPINLTKTTVIFKNLGVQRVKKQEIDKANSCKEILKVVRLKFEVYLQDSQGNTISLEPAFSNPIYNQSKLRICKLSQCTASVAGGQEIILLCEAVDKEDIQVRLFEEQNGQVIWEALADFRPEHVHKLVAIAFKTPRYKNMEVNRTIKAQIQLYRPSDSVTSPPLPFQLVPLDADPYAPKHKRLQTGGDPLKLLKLLMASTTSTNTGAKPKLKIPSSSSSQANYQQSSISQSPIQIRPKDEFPYSYMRVGSGMDFNFASDVSMANSSPELHNESSRNFYNSASPSQNILPCFSNIPNLQNQNCASNNSTIQNISPMDGLSNSAFTCTQPSAQAQISSSPHGLFNVISAASDQLNNLQHNLSSTEYTSNFESNSNWDTSSVYNTTTNDLNNPHRNFSPNDIQTMPSGHQIGNNWSNSFIYGTNDMGNLTTNNDIMIQEQSTDTSSQTNEMFSDSHETNETQLFFDQITNFQNSDWSNFGIQETRISE